MRDLIDHFLTFISFVVAFLYASIGATVIFMMILHPLAVALFDLNSASVAKNCLYLTVPAGAGWAYWATYLSNE